MAGISAVPVVDSGKTYNIFDIGCHNDQQLLFHGRIQCNTQLFMIYLSNYCHFTVHLFNPSFLLFFFFFLVRPPMSQSLLIMGWCSSIPEHWLRLHLDSGPIFNLSLLRWEIILCISGRQEFGLSLLCLCPAPLRPTGATGSQ